MNDYTNLELLAQHIVQNLTPEQSKAVAALDTPRDRYRFSRALHLAVYAREEAIRTARAETRRLLVSSRERDAERLVAEDVRNSYPDMTDAEAIAHVRNTVDPDSVYYDDLSDEADNRLTWAYLSVLGLIKKET